MCEDGDKFARWVTNLAKNVILGWGSTLGMLIANGGLKAEANGAEAKQITNRNPDGTERQREDEKLKK